MNQFEQLLSPKLKGSEIVIAIDTDNDSDYQSAETLYSHTMPLIKLRNTILHAQAIKRFSLTVGDSLIPTMSVSFVDYNGAFTNQDYPLQNDILTCVIRNKFDDEHAPIHADFLISSISKKGVVVKVNAVLALPNMFDIEAKVYGVMSSISAVSEICKTLGVGLITNATYDDTKRVLVRYKNCLSAISEVLNNYIIDGSMCKYYIGLDYNLYVVDLAKNYDHKPEDRYINDNWSTGDLLEDSIKIELNSYEGLEPENPFRIDEWRPLSSDATIRLNRSSAMLHKVAVKNYDERTITVTEFMSAIKDKSDDAQIDVISSFNDVVENPEVHSKTDRNSLDNYNIAPEHHSVMKSLFNNVMSISADISIHSTFYTAGDMLPVVIYNEAMSQESAVDNETLIEDNENKPVTSRNAQTINNQWSGNYMIDSVNYTVSSKTKRILTSLTLSKRYWGIQHIDSNQTM